MNREWLQGQIDDLRASWPEAIEEIEREAMTRGGIAYAVLLIMQGLFWALVGFALGRAMP
jgi:hypothetical protein